MERAPYSELCRNSFVYASLDNLDFMSRHACVRVTVEGRGLNCTTYLAGQPNPKALFQGKIVQHSPTQLATSRDDSAQRPRKRKLSDVEYNNDISSVSENIAMINISDNCPVFFHNFHLTEEERLSYENVTTDLFLYVMMKCSKLYNDKDDLKGNVPIMKVFLARKSNVLPVDKSLSSYIGILD